MAPFLAASLLLAFGLQVASAPTPDGSQYAEHYLRRRAAMDIKRTTTTNSTTIDWIPIESQGKIASPPPSRFRVAAKSGGPLPELALPGAERGPPGTVPVARVNLDYLHTVKKQPPPTNSTAAHSKRQNAGQHWYVSSDSSTNNHGGSATYSIFGPYVAQSSDFSLLQTAVVRSDVNGGQTVEVGWQHYPQQIEQPHLFTFFTTNGYSQWGDNIMGYNMDVAGWVQTDDTIFPGTVFGPLSQDGGDQYEINIETYLWEGNWWISVQDRWIGYYPGSLYRNAANGGPSLGDGSDRIHYYGEIAQSEDWLTTTDMGSGRFADAGFGHAAYIHNMNIIDTNDFLTDYSAGFWASDTNRYDYQEHINSGEEWGSYVYLGGPGAGGVTGG